MLTFNPKKSLRAEIFLFLLLGSLAPALIILFLYTKQLTESLHKTVIEKTEGMGVKVVRADLDSLITTFQSKVIALSKEEFLIDLLATGEEGHKRLDQLVGHRQRTTGSKIVTIYDQSGFKVASTNEESPKRLEDDFLDRIESKKNGKIRALSNFSFEKGRGFRLDVYAPVIEPFYKYLQGIIKETIFIDKKFIKKIKVKTGFEVALFNIERALIHTTIASPVLNSSTFNALIKTKKVAVQDTLSINDIPYHVALHPIINEGGSVFGSIGILASEEIIEKNIKMVKTIFIIAVLGIVALSFGVNYYSSKKLTEPIIKVVQALRKISKGDLSQKIIINSQNEIGELASSFNKMAEDLQIATIVRNRHEDFIKERTKELSKRIEELAETRKSMEKMRDDLIDAKKTAETATSAKSDFLARMSHEIRTPMNAIIGLTELSMMTDLSPKQKNYITKIDSSSHNLLGIINDILDFSKIEAGKLNIESIDFNLQEIFDNLSTLLSFQAKEKGLDLHFLISPEVPLFLNGDPLRLGQVLTNLSNNAIKFTEKGEILVTVFLEKDELDNEVTLRFSVEDNGIGITQENMEKLFQPFTQASAPTTRKSGGTGLGLVISKNLVKMMDGDIWVESIFGKGSSFIFTARFGKMAKGKKVEIKQKGTNGGIEEIKGLSGVKGAKVLLVEDNEINQLVAKELLEKIALVVTIANNGKEGVEKVKKTDFDLVFMDIQMPEMDGYEATREIRKDARFQDLPIIAMTAQAMSFDRDKCLEAGMNDYISKPINSKRLFLAVVEWIKPEERKSPVGPIVDQVYQEQEVILPELSDIDVKTGLKLIGGNRTLYKNLLIKFQRDYSNASKEITMGLRSGHIEEAERLAHTIKGIAGTIGAEKLQKSAAALEREINKGESDQYQRLLDDFEKNLGKVLDSLKAIKPVELKRTRKKTGSQAIKPKLLIKLFKTLEPHLKSHKPKKCAPVMEEILNLACPVDLDKDITELNGLIEKYKFKEAQTLIKETLRKLG